MMYDIKLIRVFLSCYKRILLSHQIIPSSRPQTIKTTQNHIKLQLQLQFFGKAKIGWQEIGRLVTMYSPICRIRLYFHHMPWSSKEQSISVGGFHRVTIGDYSHFESGRSKSVRTGHTVRTLHRCMICSSLLHDTHTAVLINTAVLILHCRTIYQNDTHTLILGS